MKNWKIYSHINWTCIENIEPDKFMNKIFDNAQKIFWRNKEYMDYKMKWYMCEQLDGCNKK